MIGFGVYYLYDTGGDFSGLFETVKAFINQGARDLVDLTS